MQLVAYRQTMANAKPKFSREATLQDEVEHLKSELRRFVELAQIRKNELEATTKYYQARLLEKQNWIDTLEFTFRDELQIRATSNEIYNRIERRVGKVTGYSLFEIRKEGRGTKRLADTRACIMYWCRRHGLTTTEIGKFMRKDHTSVVAGSRNWVKYHVEKGHNLRNA